MKVAIVGVCASGKSTLARALKRLGYEAVDVAQEHSDVPYMWRAITRPDLLIYLEASDDTVARRSPYHGTVQFIADQRARLAHARAHADAVIVVDECTAEGVLAVALRALADWHNTDQGTHDGS
ncbi:MAG: hypothetical protein HZB53_00180 [Chloroflexi bacterium]|nr:hypothetical protein [Chloroflexota bacterium]